MTEEKTTFCADCWHRVVGITGLRYARCLAHCQLDEGERLVGVCSPNVPLCSFIRIGKQFGPICSKFEPCDTFWKKVKRWWRDQCHQN